MVNCKIARLHAGAVVALSERNQRADLLYLKTEFPALPDKGQPPFVFLSITALAAVTARRGRQQADLLVVPDCAWFGPGATGQLAKPKCHCSRTDEHTSELHALRRHSYAFL